MGIAMNVRERTKHNMWMYTGGVMGVEYGVNTGIGVEVSHVEGVEDKETYIEDNMWEDLNKNGYFSERYGNCYGS